MILNLFLCYTKEITINIMTDSCYTPSPTVDELLKAIVIAKKKNDKILTGPVVILGNIKFRTMMVEIITTLKKNINISNTGMVTIIYNKAGTITDALYTDYTGRDLVVPKTKLYIDRK